MASITICQICRVRRARRECPGLAGEAGGPAQICPICCGTEREVTISCPLDCEYLREARANESRHEANHAQELDRPLAHADVKITEEFIREHDELFTGLAVSIVGASLSTPGAPITAVATVPDTPVDNDVHAALEAMIKTFRTLESGLVYETRADHRVAAELQLKLEQAIDDLGRMHSEKVGVGAYRPAEIVGILVFLARLEARFNNGRPKGRRFLDYLRLQFPDAVLPPKPTSRLIL